MTDVDVWQQEQELAELWDAAEVELALCPECESHLGGQDYCEWCEWEKQ